MIDERFQAQAALIASLERRVERHDRQIHALLTAAETAQKIREMLTEKVCELMDTEVLPVQSLGEGDYPGDEV